MPQLLDLFNKLNTKASNTTDKTLEKLSILSFDDGDTPIAEDLGEIRVDGIDTLEAARFHAFNSKYKQDHIDIASLMYGVQPHEVTDEMLKNRSNYEKNLIVNNYNKVDTPEFDPKVTYGSPKLDKPLEAYLERTDGGVDFYGRDLGKIYTPDGRNMFEGVYDTKNTDSLILPAELTQVRGSNSIWDYTHKAAFQLFHRAKNSSMTEEEKARDIKVSEIFGVTSSHQLAHDDAVANEVANIEGTDNFFRNLEVSQALTTFEKTGNPTDLIKASINNADMFLGSSMPQLAASIVTGIATGGASLGTQFASQATVSGLFSLEQSLLTMEEYKKTHGKDMPETDKYKLFGTNLAIGALEGLGDAAFLFIGKLFPGKAAREAVSNSFRQAVANKTKGLSLEVGSEFVVEDLQGSSESYFTKQESQRGTFLDEVTDLKNVGQGIIGGVVSGVITAPTATLGLLGDLASTKTPKSLEKHAEEFVEYQNNIQFDATPENMEFSNTIIERIEEAMNTNVFSDEASLETNATMVKNLLQLQADPSKLTDGARAVLGLHYIDAMKQYEKKGGNLNEIVSLTPEQIAVQFQTIYGANPDDPTLTGEELKQDIINKTIDKGFSAEEANNAYEVYRKTLEQVKTEVAKSYTNAFDTIKELQENENLSSSQEQALNENIDKVSRIQSFQENKAIKLIEALEEMSRTGDSEVLAEYSDAVDPVTGDTFKFAINKDYILRAGDNTRHGVFAVFNEAINDIDTIKSHANSTKLELEDINTSRLQDRFNQVVEKIQDDAIGGNTLEGLGVQIGQLEGRKNAINTELGAITAGATPEQMTALNNDPRVRDLENELETIEGELTNLKNVQLGAKFRRRTNSWKAAVQADKVTKSKSKSKPKAKTESKIESKVTAKDPVQAPETPVETKVSSPEPKVETKTTEPKKAAKRAKTTKTIRELNRNYYKGKGFHKLAESRVLDDLVKAIPIRFFKDAKGKWLSKDLKETYVSIQKLHGNRLFDYDKTREGYEEMFETITGFGNTDDLFAELQSENPKFNPDHTDGFGQSSTDYDAEAEVLKHLESLVADIAPEHVTLISNALKILTKKSKRTKSQKVQLVSLKNLKNVLSVEDINNLVQYVIQSQHADKDTEYLLRNIKYYLQLPEVNSITSNTEPEVKPEVNTSEVPTFEDIPLEAYDAEFARPEEEFSEPVDTFTNSPARVKKVKKSPGLFETAQNKLKVLRNKYVDSYFNPVEDVEGNLIKTEVGTVADVKAIEAQVNKVPATNLADIEEKILKTQEKLSELTSGNALSDEATRQHNIAQFSKQLKKVKGSKFKAINELRRKLEDKSIAYKAKVAKIQAVLAKLQSDRQKALNSSNIKPVFSKHMLNSSYGTEQIFKDTTTHTAPNLANTLQPTRTATNALAVVPVKANDTTIEAFKGIFNKDFKRSTLASMVKYNSAIGLFFDSSRDETSVPYEQRALNYNHNAVLAMDYAVRNLVVNKTYYFSPSTTWLEEQTIPGATTLADKIRYFEQHGAVRSLLAEDLGKDILELLGLEANENGELYAYENIVASLGNMALLYAQNVGYITSGHAVINSGQIDSAVPTVKRVKLPIKKLNSLQSIIDTMDDALDISIVGAVNTYNKVAPELITKASIKRNKDVAVSPKGIKTLNTLQQTEYKLDVDSIGSWVAKYKEEILDRMGYIRNLEDLTLDEYIAATGTSDRTPGVGEESLLGSNGALRKELNELIKAYEKEGDTSLFFNWFVGGNGRYNLKSNTLNPQTNKHLHRFLVRATNSIVESKIDDPKVIEALHFGIAATFDNIGTLEANTELGKYVLEDVDLDALLEAIITDNKEVLDKLGLVNSEGKRKYNFSDFETIGHVISTIKAVKDYRQAKAEGKTHFNNSMVVENDATTSGYFFRLLQNLAGSNIKQLLEKVGVIDLLDNTLDNISESTTIHTLKKIPGFLDIYQNLMTAIKGTPLNFEVEELTSVMSYQSKSVSVESITKFFDTYVNSLLPKVGADGVITKRLRALAKNPTMISGYSAGREKIREAVSNDITNEMILNWFRLSDNSFKTKLINNSEFGQEYVDTLEAMFKDLETKLDLQGRDLRALLKDKTATDIKFKDNPKASLHSFLFFQVDNSIGKSIVDALESTYRDDYQYSVIFNNAYRFLGDMYSIAWSEGLAKLKEQGPVTVKQFNEFVESISALRPTIFRPEDLQEKHTALPVMDSEKDFMDSRQSLNVSVLSPKIVQDINNMYEGVQKAGLRLSSKYTDVKKDGNRTASVSVRYRKPKGAVVKAAVNNIHGQDSAAIAATVLEAYAEGITILPVHDAIILNVVHADRGTQLFNEISFRVAENTNALTELLEQMQESYEVFKSLGYNPHDFKYKDKLYSVKFTDHFGAYSKLKGKGTSRMISFEDTLEELSTRVQTNWKARDAFFNSDKSYLITNVGGREGTGFITNEIKYFDKLAEEANKTEVLADIITSEEYAGNPDFILTKEKYAQFTEPSTLLSSHKARTEFFNMLVEHDTNPENATHLEFLKNLLDKFKDADFGTLYAGVVDNKAKDPSGFYSENHNTLGVILSKSATNLQTTQSAHEIYVHELVHALTTFVLNNSQQLEATDAVRQIQHIWQETAKQTDYTIFLDNVDTATELEVKKAKALYKYIFSDAKKGLAEFVSYASTNEKLQKALNKVKLSSERKTNKQSITERILDFASSVIGIFTGANKFSEVFPKFANIALGNLGVKQDMDAFRSMQSLVETLVAINNKHKQGLAQKPVNALTMMWKEVGKLRDLGNEKLSILINKMLNFSDDTPLTREDFKFGSVGQTAVTVLKVFFKLLTSEKARESKSYVLEYIAKVTGLPVDGTSTIQSIIREFSPNSPVEIVVSRLLNILKSVENMANSRGSTVTKDLRKAFGKDLSPQEDVALTEVLLGTDLSSLVDFYTPEQIEALLKDPKALEGNIRELQITFLEEARKIGKPSVKNYNLLNNLTKNLATYMLTRKGNEALVVNAKQITHQFLVIPQDTEYDFVKLVDALTTLKALQQVDKKNLDLVNKLDMKGINYFMNSHNTYKKHAMSIKRGLNEDTAVKGDYKIIPTNHYETAVYDNREMVGDLAKQFTLVSDLGNGYGLYKSKFTTRENVRGTVLALQGAHYFGNVLKVFSDSSYTSKLSKEEAFKSRRDSLRKEAIKSHKRLLQMFRENEDVSQEDIAKVSKGMIPVNFGERPDFAVTTPLDVLHTELGVESAGTHILGQMHRSSMLWERGQDHDKQVLKLLIDMTNQFQFKDLDIAVGRNMISENFFNQSDKQFYIRLHRETSDPMLKENYNTLPAVIREYIKNGGVLYVPKIMLPMLLGVKSMNAVNIKGIKGMPVQFKRIVAVAEMLMKELASLAKQTIVVKMPSVVLGNIISGMGLLISSGFNVNAVIKYTLKNWRNTKNYLADRREFETLTVKELNGTITEAEKAQHNILLNKMETNPVHELMKKGVYQAVVEDLSDLETSYVNKTSKYIQSKLKGKVPEFAFNAGRHLFMAEGTPVFNFLFDVVQMSDFVMRATGYELSLQDVDPEIRKSSVKFEKYKQQSIDKMMELFIHYDIPQSRIEQYLDDLGLMMFIKYYKRIQPTIAALFAGRPVDAVMTLLFQEFVVDTADIFESSMFVSNRQFITMPWDNFYTGFVPVIAQ